MVVTPTDTMVDIGYSSLEPHSRFWDKSLRSRVRLSPKTESAVQKRDKEHAPERQKHNG